MYEERKETFSFKSFFLTVLVVLLFTFLMLWLFPTKSYISGNKGTNTYDLDRLSVLYDEIFANNVERMKNAAIGYYTNERMPQVVGQSKKMTLQEMYDLHLVLKMKDKDGNACNVTKSYVQITKYTEEYRLKVNLSCGDQEDYIIVYLGCYSYCEDGVCEKTSPTPSDKTKEEENKYNPDPKPSIPDVPDLPDPKPEKYSCKIVNNKYYDKDGNVVSKTEYEKSCNDPKPDKKVMYEYKLETDDKTGCTAWSGWQKEAIKATDTIKVETKTENEVTGSKVVKIQTGTTTEQVTKTVTEKFIASYTKKLVKVGTKQIQTGTTTQTINEKVAVGTVEKYQGIGSGTRVPANTSTKHYKVISTDKPTSCSYCENETIYTWEIYKVETVYDIVPKTIKVPVYKTINVYEEQSVPVYDFRTVQKTETITKPVYKDTKVPVYGNVTYYRSRVCTTEKGITDIKWSYSKNDTALIEKGYRLTGNVKEV